MFSKPKQEKSLWNLLHKKEARARKEFTYSPRNVEDWNDEYFRNDCVPDSFLKTDLTDTVIALHAKGLLNWYMGGDLPLKCTDSILVVWYNMTVPGSNEFIFPSYLRSETSHPPPQDPGQVEKLKSISHSDSTMIPAQQTTTTKSTDHAVKLKTEAENWYNAMWSGLEVSEGKAPSQTVINLLGFIFMYLLRISIKDDDSVMRKISKDVSRLFTSFWGKTVEYTNTICLPSNTFILKFQSEYKRFSPKCNTVLPALIYAYGNQPPKTGIRVQKILRAGCLMTLQYTGMGIFHWTKSSAEYQEINILSLIDYMKVGRDDTTHKAIKYVLSTKQYSWPWARMFSNAFSAFDIKRDMTHLAIMVSLACGNDPSSEFWKITSLQRAGIAEYKEKALAEGRVIRCFIEAEKKKRSTSVSTTKYGQGMYE